MTLTRTDGSNCSSDTPLFAGVDADGIERIAERAVEVEFGTGQVIVRQGEIGTGFFLS